MNYPIVIVPLSEEDGSGFFAEIPDLPGCMSDGDTYQEALENVLDAAKEWIETQKELGREVPAPGAYGKRFKEERNALLETLEAMQGNYSKLETIIKKSETIDDQFVELKREVYNAIEIVESNEKWATFSGLTGVPLNQGKRKPHIVK